jgi:hypothetical protein
VLDAPEAEAEAAPRPVRTWGQAPSVARVPSRRAAAAVARRRFSESAADYAYVSKDLMTIGVLAGGLLIVLILLSFVIR